MMEDREYDIEELKKFITDENFIGKGSSGKVYKGAKAKVIKVIFYTEEPNANELNIMRMLKHPNLVAFKGYAVDEDNNKIYLVMEYMEGKSMHDFIHNNEVYTVNIVRAISWSRQIAEALNYMHRFNRPLIHRDVKPANILLNKTKDVVKLADFGFTTCRRTQMTKDKGTYKYIAPEIMNGHNYSESADVYSFAMALYEIFSGKSPFHDRSETETELAKMVIKEDLRPSLGDVDPACPLTIRQLIKKCWSPQPEDRLTMEQAVQQLKKAEKIAG